MCIPFFIAVLPSQKVQEEIQISDGESDISDELNQTEPTTLKKNKLSRTQEIDISELQVSIIDQQPLIDQQQFINENTNTTEPQINEEINENKHKPEITLLAKNVYKAIKSQQISPRKKLSKMRTTNQLELEIKLEESLKKKSQTKTRVSTKNPKANKSTFINFDDKHFSDDNSCRDSESVISIESSDNDNQSRYQKVKQRHFYKERKAQDLEKFKRLYKTLTKEKLKDTKLFKFIRDKYINNKHEKFTFINGEILKLQLKLQLKFHMQLSHEILVYLELFKFYNLKTSKKQADIKEASFDFFNKEFEVVGIILDLYWIESYFDKIKGYTQFFESYMKGKESDRNAFAGKSGFLENKFAKFNQKNQLQLSWDEFLFLYCRYVDCLLYFQKKHGKHPIEHKNWTQNLINDPDRIKMLLSHRLKLNHTIDIWFKIIRYSEDDIIIILNDIKDYVGDELSLFKAKIIEIRKHSESSENSSQDLNNNKDYTKLSIIVSISILVILLTVGVFTIITSKNINNNTNKNENSFTQQELYT